MQLYRQYLSDERLRKELCRDPRNWFELIACLIFCSLLGILLIDACSIFFALVIIDITWVISD